MTVADLIAVLLKLDLNRQVRIGGDDGFTAHLHRAGDEGWYDINPPPPPTEHPLDHLRENFAEGRGVWPAGRVHG